MCGDINGVMEVGLLSCRNMLSDLFPNILFIRMACACQSWGPYILLTMYTIVLFNDIWVNAVTIIQIHTVLCLSKEKQVLQRMYNQIRGGAKGESHKPHLRTTVSSLTRNRVSIPLFLKCLTILINHNKKQVVYQPEMPGVTTVKIVEAFKSVKESSPLSYKMGSNFYPEAFDASVVCRSVINVINNSNHNMINLRPPHERGMVWTICHDHEY
jgi:hypothetical protein